MGYETKLLVGESTSLTDDENVYGDLIVEDGEAYRPMLKDDKGNLLTTGRKETWFQVMAEIDLCKCGHDSPIHDIDRVNKDESHQWYWYHGNERRTEDCYGDRPKPVPIKTVIDALKKASEDDEYRRFKWALGLLEAMATDQESKISVLLYGY